MELQDVIIIGGGPAGLNAAIVLGRCRRKVTIFDTGEYRNRHSHGVHNYLTRDDILPHNFIALAREEAMKYSVQFFNKRITKARKNKDGIFEAMDEAGDKYYSKKMLIATGLADNIPEVPGLREMYGKSVFHCPYCDGWEVSNKKLAVYAKEKEGWELALALKAWSEDVVLLTDGKNKVKPLHKEYLNANDIPVITLPIERVEGQNGQISKVIFKNGEDRAVDGLFFVNGYSQQCNLAETFNCEVSKKGVIVTNRFQQTSIPGLFVAGDADKDVQFVVIAAAEGAKAGVIINKELQKEISERRFYEASKKMKPALEE